MSSFVFLLVISIILGGVLAFVQALLLNMSLGLPLLGDFYTAIIQNFRASGNFFDLIPILFIYTWAISIIFLIFIFGNSEKPTRTVMSSGGLKV